MALGHQWRETLLDRFEWPSACWPLGVDRRGSCHLHQLEERAPSTFKAWQELRFGSETREMANTGLWEGQGSQLRVLQETLNVTGLQVPTWDFSPIYSQDLCILFNTKQGVMTDLVHFFYHSIWVILSSKKGTLKNSSRKIDQWAFFQEEIQFLHLSTFQNKCLKYYMVQDVLTPTLTPLRIWVHTKFMVLGFFLSQDLKFLSHSEICPAGVCTTSVWRKLTLPAH